MPADAALHLLRPEGHGDHLQEEVRGPAHQRGVEKEVRDQIGGDQHPATLPGQQRLHRGGDPDHGQDVRGRSGQTVHHPPQRAEDGPVPQDQPGALPQEAGGGGPRQGVRDREGVQERGHRPHAQPRVHHLRVLHGLCGLRGHHAHDGGVPADPGAQALRRSAGLLCHAQEVLQGGGGGEEGNRLRGALQEDRAARGAQCADGHPAGRREHRVQAGGTEGALRGAQDCGRGAPDALEGHRQAGRALHRAPVHQPHLHHRAPRGDESARKEPPHQEGRHRKVRALHQRQGDLQLVHGAQRPLHTTQDVRATAQGQKCWGRRSHGSR